MGSLQLCTSVGSVLYQTCLSFLLPPAWPWPPPPLLTQATWSVPLPCSMPTLTGQECPPLTLPPPAMAAVLPSITASVVLRPMPSPDTWPMDMVIPVLMVMVFMLMVLVLPDIQVPPPPSLLDLPRDLASVVLMLNPVMDFMDMEFLLVFLTMEQFMESTSFTQLDTPSNMLPVASVVLTLMPKLMLTMVDMDMVIMDMLAMDMLTLDMVTMDMDMAMDMDIMVNLKV